MTNKTECNPVWTSFTGTGAGISQVWLEEIISKNSVSNSCQRGTNVFPTHPFVLTFFFFNLFLHIFQKTLIKNEWRWTFLEVHFCSFLQDLAGWHNSTSGEHWFTLVCWSVLCSLTQQQVGLDNADLQVPGSVGDISQHLLWGDGVFDHSDRRALPGLDDATAAQWCHTGALLPQPRTRETLDLLSQGLHDYTRLEWTRLHWTGLDCRLDLDWAGVNLKDEWKVFRSYYSRYTVYVSNDAIYTEGNMSVCARFHDKPCWCSPRICPGSCLVYLVLLPFGSFLRYIKSLLYRWYPI